MPISTKIRLTMLCLSGFELYSRWVPLYFVVNCEFDLCLGMSNVNFTFFYVVIVWLTT